MNDDEISNFQLFRDCLSTPLIEKSAEKPTKKSRRTRGKGVQKTAIKPVAAEKANNAEELADFIDVCTNLIGTQSILTDRSMLPRKSSLVSRPRFELYHNLHGTIRLCFKFNTQTPSQN
jgi:hypothetical protein